MQNISLKQLKKAHIKINISHLIHNARLLKKRLGNVFFCPVVKVNAYGHGLSLIVQALQNENIDAFCVASVDEAVQCRSFLTKPIPIIIFTADYTSYEIQACLDYNLTPVIGQMTDLIRFQSASFKLNIHLKFDTGLHCHGFSIDEMSTIKEQLAQSPYLNLTGVATHLAKAYDAGLKDGYSFIQQKQFIQIQKLFGPQNYHYQNSACILLQKDITCGGRPGIALYGVLPYTHKPVSVDLRPVMSFQTHLINIRKIKKGVAVSYEHQWTAKRDSVIGLIPIGYADGLRRNLTKEKIYFLIEGQKVPQIGVIRMNCCLVDLTDMQREVSVGTRVVIFGESYGKHLTVEQLARRSKLAPYEILTGLRSDIERIPIYEKAKHIHTVNHSHLTKQSCLHDKTYPSALL